MKNILLLVHDDAGQEARLQAALDLTRAVGGHLKCVDVAVIPMMVEDYVPVGGGAMLLADEQAREHANREKLQARLAREDVAYDWKDVTGDLVQALQESAGLVDIIVLNRELDDSGYPDMIRVIGELVVDARKPVLAMPADVHRFDATGPAMIAWDGSGPAEESLRAAMPLLQLASEAVLVEVNECRGDRPADDAAAYLSRHGIKAEVNRVPKGSGTVCAALIEAAQAMGAAYIVMGGYGHARLIETLFGGVTRRMLRESPVPLLIAH